MKKTTLFSIVLVFLIFLGTSCSNDTSIEDKGSKIVMIVHGGAGVIKKEYMTPEKEKAYRDKLTEALQAGYEVLHSGKSSLDAVQSAIHVMENSPLFNAGKGAVFTHDGINELDASIMDGSNLKAGAVAGVMTVKNPIDAARAVMDKTWHVMLMGKGADKFAKEAGCTIVPNSYFYTEERWEQLQRALRADSGDVSALYDYDPKKSMIYGVGEKDKRYGTVGCVALDQNGDLAAGTSTGGLTDKKHGRIGDSPIIGAGTYANNKTAGISCTGQGEYFIRELAAHRVSDLIDLKGLSLAKAAKQTIQEIGEMGGSGGMIGLNTKGEVAMPFNTAGMYRGTVDEDGNIKVQIY